MAELYTFASVPATRVPIVAKYLPLWSTGAIDMTGLVSVIPNPRKQNNV